MADRVTIRQQNRDEIDSARILQLPGIDYSFNTHMYLKAAADLQEMGKVKACSILSSAALKDDGQVILLSRMLFQKKPRGGFRSPKYGDAKFLAFSKESDWSLSPIELINDVPFMIVTHYIISGESEQSSDYLEYCFSECMWSVRDYRNISESQIDEALALLLTSNKWGQTLTDSQRQFLIKQAR